MSQITAASPGLLHMIYPYAGQQQYVAGTLSYIEQARAAGAAVLVATSQERRALLGSHLPSDDGVTFMDTAALGRNPGRLIPAWQDWIDRRTDGRAVHGINDATATQRGSAYEGEARYAEWLLNQAFAKAPAWSLLCPVDTGLQSASAIESLTRCHPQVWDGTGYSPVADYFLEPYAQDDLTAPTGAVECMTFTIDELSAVRDKVASFARAHGLPLKRTRELILAVSEVATNSIRYGGGTGTLVVWAQEDALICELRDDGVITDALVGQRRPPASQLGGRGLWFVNQLCDLVQLRSAPGRGTRIRLWIDRTDRHA
ncbi:sensor histidine kinase [Actinospica sp. MGRD01-02]|uniref:Sensor histidine kinase n=1 Tax=Actinospica acidithermotolerans TaxID=2828514 RepID=A0A941E4K8_9ACTN|nr:sensor histidine kinase [Actinospica acidithermotolerans]MBR7825016.1 sensor histidine kinase [Actinospica acidithermotolerans]